MFEDGKVRGLQLGGGIPAICVPLTAAKREELLREAEAAKKSGADLVEWRADMYQELSLESLGEVLLQLRGVLGQMPLLFTLRTKEEGGSSFSCSRERYEEICLGAAKTGLVDLMDVEALRLKEAAQGLVQSISALGVAAIASSHDFAGTREDEVLQNRLDLLAGSGAPIVKMAVMPKAPEDVTRFMEVIKAFQQERKSKVIAMSMGELGQASRIQGERFGSCLTFGTVGAASAPGQIPVGELKKALLAVHRELTGDAHGV